MQNRRRKQNIVSTSRANGTSNQNSRHQQATGMDTGRNFDNGTSTQTIKIQQGSDTTRNLMRDINSVVGHQPDVSKLSDLVHNIQKSSEDSLIEDDMSEGDKIEMQLLSIDDPERSKVMHQLIVDYQEKVLCCLEHYKPELTLSCLRIVTALSALSSLKSKTAGTRFTINRENIKKERREGGTDSVDASDPFAELDVEEALHRELPNFTVSRLRATVQQLLRHASLRLDASLFFTGSSENSIATKSVQYFIWYFDFLDYLQDLFNGFIEKIFTPLFKYFQDQSFIKSSGRSHSMSSTLSRLSYFSDSDTEKSGQRESYKNDKNVSGPVCKRQQARASLLQLSKEYKDIRSIYDTSEIDKIAQRLSIIKEQIEYLLNEEDEVDPEIYGEESGKIVECFDMDFGTENLIRLVPDILIKLKKSAWLARTWLELDDSRTKDIAIKAKKLTAIEEELCTRIRHLQRDIHEDERKLARETDALGSLMVKEGRCESLSLQSYSVESQAKQLQEQIENLEAEKRTFPTRLQHVVRNKNLSEFYKLKHQFERNKLKRLLASRRLVTLKYQLALTESDLGVEMMVRPSVIHCSNTLQDECERLERTLREKRDQIITFQAALGPVQEDRLSVTNRLLRESTLHSEHEHEDVHDNAKPDQFGLIPGKAIYLRSHHAPIKRRSTTPRDKWIPNRTNYPLIGPLPVNNRLIFINNNGYM